MADTFANCIHFKKQHALSKDIYDCEMNNTYAKRLHYQQMKGMRFSSYKTNPQNQTTRSPVFSNDSMMDVESNDDRVMEIEENVENEGENIFKYRCSPMHSPQSNSSLETENSRNETSCDKSYSHGSIDDVDSCLDISIISNSFSPLKHNTSSETSFIADRYIPSRSGSRWQKRFSMLPDVKTDCCGAQNCHGSCNNSVNHEESKDLYVAYSSLLRNELLDSKIESVKKVCEDKLLNTATDTNIFRYGSSREIEKNLESCPPFTSSPIGPNSQKLLRSPRKTTRKISRIPFKVLDAPELQDDFYLNLVDWSSQNVLSVGLGNCVYLWSASTSQVTRLCDLSSDANSVTSVSWSERGNLVAVGTHQGFVQIWDVTTNKLVSKLVGHTSRVGAVAWNGDILSSGSRDRMIIQRDIRTPSSIGRRLSGHRQEVCGLKWSPDNQHLASGGNDNRLLVWNMHSLTPMQVYTDHQAAVKAIAWSPHQHGLLASGGGTADRCIRFWNTLTGQPMQCVDTGSQVCNLVWSKHSSEFVSTHGYSQNQIIVWKYPNLTQIAKLTGHSFRVLYLAMSPDGESIVTGAGDETLRFWNVFSKVRSHDESKSVLNLFRNIR